MRLDNSQRAFFALVRAGLWPDSKASFIDAVKLDSIDWAGVYKLGEEQSVIGLMAAGIEMLMAQESRFKVPQEWAFSFIGRTLQIEQRNIAMNAFIAGMIERLHIADIYTILVKGQGVAQCYEKPLWRVSGDVDLLLSDKQYEKAKSFLLTMGEMTELEETGKKHFAMRIGSWEVELHGTLHGGLSSQVDRVMDKLQEEILHKGKVRSWMNGNTPVFLPSANEDVIYVFAHILQHFYKGGIGLRQICDWCRLLYTYGDSLDYKLLESRIMEMGLMAEWKAFGAFAVEYLGMPADAMPFLNTGIVLHTNLKRKAERIKDFVMEVGNFGHNRDNSYFHKHSYLVRKSISAWRRIQDLYRHTSIFPGNALRFSLGIMWNGMVSAVRGE